MNKRLEELARKSYKSEHPIKYVLQEVKLLEAEERRKKRMNKVLEFFSITKWQHCVAIVFIVVWTLLAVKIGQQGMITVIWRIFGGTVGCINGMWIVQTYLERR